MDVKIAIVATINKDWIDIFNVFVESWIKDKPKDVDFIVYHGGDVKLEMMNYEPNILKEVGKDKLETLNKLTNHKHYKPGWNIMASRIFALEELRSKYDYLLYLDADTIVCDLPSLLSLRTESYLIAVESEFVDETAELIQQYLTVDVSKYLTYKEQRYINPNGYINAGVMMFNLNKVNSLPFDISIMFISCFSNLPFIDQDFINLLFSNDIEIVDRSYNFCCPPALVVDKSIVPYSKEIVNHYLKYLDKPKVIHYINGWRPWDIGYTKKSDIFPFDKILTFYLDVFRRTPNLNQLFVDRVEGIYKQYKLKK
jgi:lipopolysaccharide biosynthesis glycosyltransferase